MCSHQWILNLNVFRFTEYRGRTKFTALVSSFERHLFLVSGSYRIYQYVWSHSVNVKWNDQVLNVCTQIYHDYISYIDGIHKSWLLQVCPMSKTFWHLFYDYLEEYNFILYPQFANWALTFCLPWTFCIETLQLNMLHNVL